MKLAPLTDALATGLLVHCAECAEPLPTYDGNPVGASVPLATGERLFWCSADCLDRTTKRSRLGGAPAEKTNVQP